MIISESTGMFVLPTHKTLGFSENAQSANACVVPGSAWHNAALAVALVLSAVALVMSVPLMECEQGIAVAGAAQKPALLHTQQL